MCTRQPSAVKRAALIDGFKKAADVHAATIGREEGITY
jgi:hypothetical protein